MLSRLAQAPRLGLAAGLTRPAPWRVLRTRSTAIAISPWARAYAKNRGGSSRPFNNTPKQSPTPPRPDNPSSSPASSSSPAYGSPSGASPSTAKPADKSDVNAAKDQNATEAPKDAEQIAFNKLPDLTRGIPSTLEAEMEEKTNRSESSLQTIERPSGASGGGGRRDPYVSTSERNRRWWTRFLLVGTATGSVLGILYMGRNWDDTIDAERHSDIPNGPSPGLWWRRVKARMTESVSYYQDPAFDKLLPNPDPSFERPYTLCISLDDLLVHSEWSREHGWRVAKRPGVDYFIHYLSQYYEIVLFTTVPWAIGEPLVRKLDPFRFMMWALYREATKYEDGEIVKDLAYLNRDLSKVIIIDTKAEHVRKQPENAIILDPWKGDTTDNDLVSLIPFLEYIHTMQYADVRKVLKSFDDKHIPTEFARREAIARKEFNAQYLAEKAKHKKPSGMGALGNLLGLKPSKMSMIVQPDGEQNASEAFAQGKMLQDIARERGQRNYELLEREIRENGERWLKEEKAAMEKAQQEAMSSMMGSFSGVFGAKAPGEGGAGGVDKKA